MKETKVDTLKRITEMSGIKNVQKDETAALLYQAAENPKDNERPFTSLCHSCSNADYCFSYKPKKYCFKYSNKGMLATKYRKMSKY